MKKLLFTFALAIASVTMFAQNFDVFVTNMSGYTRQYNNNQVADLYNNYYGVPQSTLNGYYNDFGSNWGNVALGLELSRILGIPMPDVRGIYDEGASNGQGWGVMAKRYGIKPGSAAFHRMKNTLGKSQREWGGIFGDYGKNKDPRVARKDINVFENGVVKPKNGKVDKRFEKMVKEAKNNNNNKGNAGNKGNQGNKGNSGNQGKGKNK